MKIEKEILWIVQLRAGNGAEFKVYPRACSAEQAEEKALLNYSTRPTVVSVSKA